MLLKVVLKGDYNTGGHSENVFYFESDEDILSNILDQFLDDLAEYFTDFLIATIVDLVWDNFTYNAIELYQSEDIVEGTWIKLGETSISVPGTEALQGLPEQLATYLYFPVQGGTRGGSLFLPGWTETSNIDGSLTSGLLTDLAAYAVIFLADYTGTLTGIQISPRLYSPTLGLFLEYAGAVAIKTIFSNQNRRRRDIGV
jgi:hypothetical protein